jgi:Tol biopolymer transport system component
MTTDSHLRSFALSADGNVVVFNSEASNLHPLDTDTDNDVFARNIVTGVTHLVSVNESGTASGNGASRAPQISANGNVVAFTSSANDLESLDQDPGTQ